MWNYAKIHVKLRQNSCEITSKSIWKPRQNSCEKHVEIHMKIYMIITNLSMISIMAEHLRVYHLGVAESLTLLGKIEVMS